MVNQVKKPSSETQNFKDLIKKLNSISEKTEKVEVAIQQQANKPKTKLTEAVQDGMMKDIIGRFNVMIEESVTPTLLKESVESEFDLAVKTKQTDNGVKIGDWEIVKITEDKNISYDIINANSNEVILENLKTYVAANAIVNLLNAGAESHTPEVSSFVKMDEDFDMNYNDAIRYRKKFTKTGKAIYEDRYNVCKSRAIQLKEKMLENLADMGKK